MNEQNTKPRATSTLKSKFTSRKFLLSLVGIITGICGIIGCNDSTIAVIAFIALEVLSIVSYGICESKVDAADRGLDIAQEVINVLNSLKQTGHVDIPDQATGIDYINTLPLREDHPPDLSSIDDNILLCTAEQKTTTTEDHV